MPTMPVSDNLIRLLGRYSEGLRLAVEHGPTSGVLFEYACRNTPQGSGTIGRLIDRTFLHLSAWDGIRQRIQTSKELVVEIVTMRRTSGLPTVILDVASGTGRYLREIARERAGKDLVIHCRDRDPRQVMLGRQLAGVEGLSHFTFGVGDATDDSSYLVNDDPHLVLAIGLFPYLHRDEEVRTVMQLSFSHLGAGGCFICTTLSSPRARLPHWETNGFGTRAAIRSPETIAAWLRSSGFVRITQRVSQPAGFALIGWKPEEA
jgi:SAM-dependent methyltransferase